MTLLRARRINLIPKEGETLEGFKFNFHGGGCYFEFDNSRIDVDFGPNGRCDGFDSFRLYDFLQTSKLDFKDVLLEENIRTEISRLEDEGIIVQPNEYPNPALFYLLNGDEYN